MIRELFNDCQSNDLEYAFNSLDDLGYLIERNTLDHPMADYSLVFHRKELKNLNINNDTKRDIVFFLFFLLLNYPDRSSRTAWCLVKCYDSTIVEGLCQGIELYFDRNDVTVWFLIKAITDINEFADLDDRTLLLFKKLKERGLAKSKEAIIILFNLYKKNFNFIEDDLNFSL